MLPGAMPRRGAAVTRRRGLQCLAPAIAALILFHLIGLSLLWQDPQLGLAIAGHKPSQQRLVQARDPPRPPPPPLWQEPPMLGVGEPAGACALDAANGSALPAEEHGERFLLYQPQFGLSNQIVALRNAVVWALLLKRTLVVPHLLGHGTALLRAPHGLSLIHI